MSEQDIKYADSLAPEQLPESNTHATPANTLSEIHDDVSLDHKHSGFIARCNRIIQQRNKHQEANLELEGMLGRYSRQTEEFEACILDNYAKSKADYDLKKKKHDEMHKKLEGAKTSFISECNSLGNNFQTRKCGLPQTGVSIKYKFVARFLDAYRAKQAAEKDYASYKKQFQLASDRMDVWQNVVDMIASLTELKAQLESNICVADSGNIN